MQKITNPKTTKKTMTRMYGFTLVTTDKSKEWSLHEVIKRHFRIYYLPNLNAALHALAENLKSEFGLVESYEIKKLGESAWQINIGTVLVVKFSSNWYGHYPTQLLKGG